MFVSGYFSIARWIQCECYLSVIWKLYSNYLSRLFVSTVPKTLNLAEYNLNKKRTKAKIKWTKYPQKTEKKNMFAQNVLLRESFLKPYLLSVKLQKLQKGEAQVLSFSS